MCPDTEIQRFSHAAKHNQDNGWWESEEVPDPDGKFVTYADHLKVLSERDAREKEKDERIAELEAEAEHRSCVHTPEEARLGARVKELEELHEEAQRETREQVADLRKAKDARIEELEAQADRFVEEHIQQVDQAKAALASYLNVSWRERIEELAWEKENEALRLENIASQKGQEPEMVRHYSSQAEITHRFVDALRSLLSHSGEPESRASEYIPREEIETLLEDLHTRANATRRYSGAERFIFASVVTSLRSLLDTYPGREECPTCGSTDPKKRRLLDAYCWDSFHTATSDESDEGDEGPSGSDLVIRVEADKLDGGFVARVADLPGCVSQGATVPETLTNLGEAYEGVTASANKPGGEAPSNPPPAAPVVDRKEAEPIVDREAGLIEAFEREYESSRYVTPVDALRAAIAACFPEGQVLVAREDLAEAMQFAGFRMAKAGGHLKAANDRLRASLEGQGQSDE